MSVMQKLLEINDELVRTLAEREQLRIDQKTLQEICSMSKQRITELQAELRKVCAERDQAVEHAARLQAQLAEVKNQLEAVVQERYNLQTELNTKDKQLQELIMSQPDFGVERMPKKSAKPAEQNGLVRDVSHYVQAAEVDRPIEPQPEAQPIQVCEGRWQTRGGAEVSVSAMPTDHDDFSPEYPWWDGDVTTWGNDGVFLNSQTASNDLVEYLGPTEPQQPAEPQEFNPYTFAAYIVGDKSQPDALRIVWATEEWIQHANFGIVHRMKDSFETLTLNLKVQ